MNRERKASAIISIRTLYVPKRRAAFGLRAGREMREIAEGGTKSKIGREVQILPSPVLYVKGNNKPDRQDFEQTQYSNHF